MIEIEECKDAANENENETDSKRDVDQKQEPVIRNQLLGGLKDKGENPNVLGNGLILWNWLIKIR